MTTWLDPAPVDTSPLESLGLNPLIAQTLIRRGSDTPEAVRVFLNPDSLLSTPFPGIEKATERVYMAIRSNEHICVWGDFDVDGQAATALLVETLQALGAKVTYHIPVRGRESHGVHLESLKAILDDSVHLIITCDTGITAHEAVEYARSRSVDVIITDHHDLGETLPNALAVINPKRLPEGHPLATLAGAGVAYKLAEALLGGSKSAAVNGFQIESLLDLAALGLVADLALLTGETRTLVQRGLGVLQKTERVGLRLMCELADIDPASITEAHISFVLAPRLNALGRLADANPAVELLTTRDPNLARQLALKLEGLNAQRKLLTDQVSQAAEALLQADPSLLSRPVLILGHSAWPGGVIGIVANRLAERYHKPTILFSTPDGEPMRGSARSVEGIHITEAIARQRDILLSFGGHPMAAGLSLLPENLPEFRRRINHWVEQQRGAVAPEGSLQIDAWLPLESLDLDLAAATRQLAPFGPGNPSLTLASRELRLQSHRTIGRGDEHVKLTVRDKQGTRRDVLWWNGANEPILAELAEGATFDLAYSLDARDYRGERQLTLELLDLRITEAGPVQAKAPALEILDYRQMETPQSLLTSLPSGTLIWAEGKGCQAVSGRGRHELERAATLAIWTTPPGPTEMHSAVRQVAPQTIYLFAQPPSVDTPQALLTHLAGLVKFSINHRGGQATLPEMAAALAQRESAVSFGLEWLAAAGHIRLEAAAGGIHIANGDNQANPILQNELFTILNSILAETSAYRKYFSEADKDNLLLPFAAK